MSISELQDGLSTGAFSSQELTQSYLDAIEKDNTGLDPVNAFISVHAERALAEAVEADKRRKAGQVGKLLGIPLAIKDNMNIEGLPTTCASKILEGYTAVYTATAVSRLQEHGAVILGKTNMDEFAMGSSTENSGFGITRNPANRSCIPGGSSGGSAAAVAAGFSPAALGSDTGGSIRQPASHCGVVGLKPTYGRVSRNGLVAFASSLDQIGPITRNVQDAALMLEILAGHDPQDSTSVSKEASSYTSGLEGNLKGLRVGVPREYFGAGMDPEVESIIKAGLKTMEALGAELIDISLPHTEYAVEVYYIVATAEASSNLARFDGIRYGHRDSTATDLISVFTKSRANGFGSEVKRRIMLGTYVLSSGYYDAYYLKALKARSLIKGDFTKAFEKVDIIASPVSPGPAFPIGEKINDPVAMYLSDIYTISVNLAGIPGISVPAGFTSGRLPVGLQLLAGHFCEQSLLQTAARFEKARN
jgi:aspartyl-tRNA(Asn)/glutamyl-tRNA(Gln) amidotransferase subunit A